MLSEFEISLYILSVLNPRSVLCKMYLSQKKLKSAVSEASILKNKYLFTGRDAISIRTLRSEAETATEQGMSLPPETNFFSQSLQ